MSRKLNERLMNAVKNNQREEVKFLLNAGADVNAKDVYGSTPLHFATNYARSHIMELLVEYGADVNAQDKNGITKLMQVCSYGDIEMAGYLLEHGANPMITDLLGENSMDYAKRVMYADSQFQEKPVVTYKKLRTMLIKHATREKGMDISLLIKELQKIEKTHPNATVKMNNLYGMPVMRVVPGKESDEVWLEGREDFDVTVELRARYEEASEMQEDELTFFTDMLNRGFTLSDFRTALKEDTFQYAKAFMEEHGLI